MSIRIIADSCCDITPDLQERIQLTRIPLIVTVDGKDYVDDGTIHIPDLIYALAHSETTAISTCPTPDAYAEAMLQCDECFVVTLSSNLSGSHNAACVAKNMVLESHPSKKIHICDSLSAAVAETQIAAFIRDKIEKNLSFEEIIPLVTAFSQKIRTFFVLEDLGNLFKNGRMSKVAGRIVSMIKLCPIMGEDGEGNIRFVSPSLGIERSLRKLVELVQHRTQQAKAKSVNLMLGFCNCLPRAEMLKERFLSKCPALSSVTLVPTGGLSSMYANNGGIIIAFLPSNE